MKRISGRDVWINMMATVVAIGSWIFTCDSLPAEETDASSHAQITVYAGKNIGTVNRLVFGQNLEVADSKDIFGSNTEVSKIKTGEGMWDVENRSLVPAFESMMKDMCIGMMRYPGGCLAHNYDWKKSVGPRDQRGNWQFGLDEYLESCRVLKMEPLITVSDYVLPAEEMPKHAAELVEYLNSPATPEHPWALKRKEWGHPEPFGVKWFELGNESDHGNHKVLPKRKYTGEAYAKYARETAAAMRAVDPTIKIGVVTVPGIDFGHPWTKESLKLDGSIADFVVIHFYSPGIFEGIIEKMPNGEAMAMASCMGASDQLEWLIGRFHNTVKEACGRDLPLAMTEYNVGSVGEKPKPYRYSYGGALMCADLVRVFLKPENKIAMANYWHLINGFWGMIDSTGGTIRGRPAYPLYKLWGQHFGDNLVATEVKGPKAEMVAFCEMVAAKGDKHIESKFLTSLDWADSLVPSLAGGKTFKTTVTKDGGLRVEIKDHAGNVYPTMGNMPAPAGAESNGCDYVLGFEAKYTPAEGTQTAQMGLGLVDSRGWDMTRSGIALTDKIGSEWKQYRKQFKALPDATGVSLIERLEPGNKKISGVLEIRNLKIEAYSTEVFPAYDLITISSSLSTDKKKLYLIVFNKSVDRNINATIQINDFIPTSAKAWEVNAPALSAIDGAKEVMSGQDVPFANEVIQREFPAHSMTAIELTRQIFGAAYATSDADGSK